MRKKRFRLYHYIACIMIFAFISGLTGCQLAVDNKAGKTNVEDVLCGAFLTFDEKGLSGKLQNDMVVSSISGNGVSLRDKVLSDGKSIVEGVRENNTVKFEGVKGYFIGIVPEKNKNVNNSVAMADNGFTDVSQNIKDVDGNTETITEATFQIPTDNFTSYFIHPVYKKDDGTFYTILKNSRGNSFSGDTVNMSSSVQFDNAIDENTDGYLTKHVKQSVKITVKPVDPVKKIIIKEMNSKDEVITTAEVKNSGGNEIHYKTAPATDYVIVEETLHNNKAQDYINRSVYSFGKEEIFYHSCNFPTDHDSIGAIALVISK